MIYNSDNHFNGTLDEARIHKRILGSAEINASFNNNANRLYNNFTGLSNAVYNYSAWMVDLSGNVNKSITRGVTVSVSGGTPTNPSTGINSTARSNTTLSDLNCYATINDPNSD